MSPIMTIFLENRCLTLKNSIHMKLPRTSYMGRYEEISDHTQVSQDTIPPCPKPNTWTSSTESSHGSSFLSTAHKGSAVLVQAPHVWCNPPTLTPWTPAAELGRKHQDPSLSTLCQPPHPRAHLFCCPKRGLSLFIHFPYVWVLDGEDDKPAGIFSEKRLLVRVQAIFSSIWRGALKIKQSSD